MTILRCLLDVASDAIRLGPGPRRPVPSPLLRAAGGIRWTGVDDDERSGT